MIEKCMKNNNYILRDFTLNILASGVLTAILQLLVYPILAAKMTSEEYGSILTIMGLQNTIINTIGNALNNVRLIQNHDYAYNDNGDFNIILKWTTLISVCIYFFVFVLVFKERYKIVIGLIIALILGIMRLYYSAAFRLVINLKKTLQCNCVIAFGYALGVLLYRKCLFWPGIFITGEAAGVLFLSKKSFLFDFSFNRTHNFKGTLLKFKNLSFSTALGSAVTYMDRLIILPILGAAAVSTYTVASLVGKMLGIVMLPIAGVMLSYYSQKGFTMKKKYFRDSCLILLIICIIFYLGTLILGKFIVGIFYPTLTDDAIKYMWIANLAAIISIYGNMLSPIVLKFCESIWQIIITSVYAIIYMLLACVLSVRFGLIGFCWASVISNGCRNIMMLIVGKRGVEAFET